MISKFAISSSVDAAKYHDKAFVQDGGRTADNYYVNESASAKWQGEAAKLLAIEGQSVKREDFIAFLEGKMPVPGSHVGAVQDLADNSRGADRRLGWDFTVAPPKSVSVVALVGGDERVVEAHQKANAAAMGWLEDNASTIRIKDANGSNVKVQSGNLLYATVTHETNRENEPHLHNHNVIVAATFDADRGKWRSLTNDELFQMRADADVIYKASLAKELRGLGYELNYKTGTEWEIAGITDKQLEVFSTRSQQIKDALVARNLDPGMATWEARQAATLDSRSAKVELPRDRTAELWRDVGQRIGLDASAVVSRAKERVMGAPEQLGVTLAEHVAEQSLRSAREAVSWAIEHLSEREQAFKSTDLESTASKFGRGDLGDVRTAVGEHVKGHQLMHRVDVNTGGSEWFTTSKALGAEMRLLSHVQAGRGQAQTVLQTEAQFQQARDQFEVRKTQETGKPFELSSEQLNAARNILMHGDRFQYIQGDAGTGKTAAMEFVRDTATAQGWKVMGMATTSNAAKELARGSGIESQTVAGFLFDRDNALRLARTELAQMTDAIAKGRSLQSHAGAQTAGQPRAVDRAHVNALSFSIDFGKNRYAFDHQRGDAYKLDPKLSSRFGLALMDVTAKFKDWRQDQGHLGGGADQASIRVRGDAAASSGVPSAARPSLAMRGIDGLQALGQRLVRYEKVGSIEAIAARNAWYAQQPDGLNALVASANRREAEISNLERTGDPAGRKTLLVMDEASMTGIYDTEKVAALASQIGARAVFQGDSKQHGSVPAGRAFAQAQQLGINISRLTETRRFDQATAQVKQAVVDVNQQRFKEALLRLDTLKVDGKDLSAKTAEQWLKSYDALKAAHPNVEPRIGVVAPINRDRKDINAAIHKALQVRGMVGATTFAKEHLDNPKLTQAQQLNVGMMANAKVDRLVFRKNYRELGIEKGDVLTVRNFKVMSNQVVVENSRGHQVTIDPARQDWFTPMRMEKRDFAVGASVEARANISVPAFQQSEGADKSDTSRRAAQPAILERVSSGTRGTILHIDKDSAVIAWTDGKRSALSNKDLLNVDFAYAHTSIKEQGQTNAIELIAVGNTAAKVFNRETAYVTVTRAKDNAILITSDHETLLKNAGRDVSKTTAMSNDHAVYKADLELTAIIKEMKATQDHRTTAVREQSIEPSKSKQAQHLQERGKDLSLGL